VKRTIAFLAGVATLGGAVYLGNQLWAQPQANPGVPPGAQMPPAVTRVAVVNLGQVIRNYVKFQNFEATMNSKKAEVRKNIDGINNRLTALQAEAAKPETPTARREQIDKEMRELQRQAQDYTEDSKANLSKAEFDHLVQTFKEVQEAVTAYARTRSIELVLHYTDAIGTDQYLPQFFARKLQNGACYPLYAHPSLDITSEVTNMLNSRVTQATAAPQPGRQ
jgi:Skp family chaperone for outer membrane proteins